MSSPSPAGLIHILHGFFNLLFRETALLTWCSSLRMLLIRPEGHQGTMQQAQSLAKHLVEFELWSFRFWKLCLNPCMGCYCNNQFHSVTSRHLVVAWEKWVDLNALYKHRIWFNLQSLSFCTLPRFWQIKYSSQLLKDMIWYIRVWYNPINIGKDKRLELPNTYTLQCKSKKDLLSVEYTTYLKQDR